MMKFSSTTSVLAVIASNVLVDGFHIAPAVVTKSRSDVRQRYQSSTSPLFAKKKKKKGGGGGGKQKKGGFEWASSFTLKPQEATITRELASSAAASFKARTGKSLAPELDGGVMDAPKALWDASVACMVVDQEDGATVVKYANAAALETVGLKPNEFEKLYSTSIKEEERQQLKPVVTVDLPSVMNGDKKYESGYKKKMLKREDGDDITIIGGHRWALEKSALTPEGKFETTSLGVAYAWNEWLVGDDIIYSPGGSTRIAVDPAKLEEEVAAKAAHIRSLKEDQGLNNKDPEVVEAVEELLALKEALEQVKQSS
jgi:hypothetical protein